MKVETWDWFRCWQVDMRSNVSHSLDTWRYTNYSTTETRSLAHQATILTEAYLTRQLLAQSPKLTYLSASRTKSKCSWSLAAAQSA